MNTGLCIQYKKCENIASRIVVLRPAIDHFFAETLKRGRRPTDDSTRSDGHSNVCALIIYMLSR